jgi:hypothetical protein
MIGSDGHITPGIALRLSWAILTALCLGAWLWQRSRSRDALITPAQEQATAWLRGFLLTLCGFWMVAWLLIALVRLPYPFELEWNGGAMLDHCERLVNHLPLYVPPSGGWFPYEYPPLYMAVCAFFMSWLGGPSYAVMRLVSIGSTLGCAAILFLWVRRLLTHLTPLPVRENLPPNPLPTREGATYPQPPPDAGRGYQSELDSPFPVPVPIISGSEANVVGKGAGGLGRTWAWVAVGLFFVGYRLTGAWYDLERLDMLFLFLTLLGGYWLELSLEEPFIVWRASILAFLAAGALSLAFLTKQQALLFLVGGAVALVWKRAWPQLILYTVMALAVCGDAVWLLNASSDGWFGYYCFRIPFGNGIRLNLAAQYLLVDLPLLLPCVVMLVLAFVERRRLTPPLLMGGRLRRGGAVLTAMTVMAVLGSWLLRAHWGGYENVLIPGYIFLIASACVAAGRWERARHAASVPLYLLFLAQMVTLAYRPLAQLPTFANRAAGMRFQEIVRALNTQGDVLCMDHGHVTIPRHFQIMALGDVIRADQTLPPDLVDRIKNRRFAAIVMDNPPVANRGLNGLILQYYAPAETPQIGGPWVVTGFETPVKGRIFVLRPRR